MRGYEKRSDQSMINVMAPSPSDPYQSRIIRSVVRQARRWLDRSQITLRRVQVAASWSTQILLYPVYAVFQAGRLMGRTLERSQASSLPDLDPASDDIPLTSDATVLTTDTPLQKVLQTLQQFELPDEIAIAVTAAPTIRAIASQLDTRTLVLVTNQHHILTIPDPAQQYWLQQRIIYEIAVFNRRQRSRHFPWQRVNRVIQGIRTVIQNRLPGSRAAGLKTAPSLSSTSTPASFSDAIADFPSDTAIKQSLLAVRERLITDELPVLSASTTATAIAESDGSALSTTSRLRVRGVASCLVTRELVLVTTANQVLHVLSSHQQHSLHQRIAWEVAHYQRHLRLQTSAIALEPFRLPAKPSLLLPPIRAFQWLMTWMQSGSVALAANLFQEASWLTYPLPTVTEFNPAAIVPTLPAPAEPNTIAHGMKTPGQTGRSPHSTDPDYIDTDVTWVGYEQSWLERVMRWLDQLFLWVETQISKFFKSFN